MLKIKKKNYVERIFFNDGYCLNSIKKNLFKGKILILDGFPLQEIIKDINKTFNLEFNLNLNDFLFSKYLDESIFNDQTLKSFQKKVKNSNTLKTYFFEFLKFINFDIKKTYSDKITFRFSPQKSEKPLGYLKPALPHRDTWASNFQAQINWWIPLHDVDEDNTIYFVPKYFKKKIDNDSLTWSFDKYKKGTESSSTPVVREKIEFNDLLTTSLRLGQILCFSGHHVHGSNLSSKRRVNLEVRTISLNDSKNFHIPANLDSYNNIKRYKWFKSLNNLEYYEE